jgi:hypothetical protein
MPVTGEELQEIAQRLRADAKRINPAGNTFQSFTVDSSQGAPLVDGDLREIARQLEMTAGAIGAYLLRPTR